MKEIYEAVKFIVAPDKIIQKALTTGFLKIKLMFKVGE